MKGKQENWNCFKKKKKGKREKAPSLVLKK